MIGIPGRGTVPSRNFGHSLAERRSTPIWRRRARISIRRAAHERKNENRLVRNGDKVLNIRKFEVSEKERRGISLRPTLDTTDAICRTSAMSEFVPEPDGHEAW